uniref:Uncharacterized protein n=1 Tax=Anguilla anguilla TaxID=7936 RepID=A0A0E9QVQ9_ANGAN
MGTACYRPQMSNSSPGGPQCLLAFCSQHQCFIDWLRNPHTFFPRP